MIITEDNSVRYTPRILCSVGNPSLTKKKIPPLHLSIGHFSILVRSSVSCAFLPSSPRTAGLQPCSPLYISVLQTSFDRAATVRDKEQACTHFV